MEPPYRKTPIERWLEVMLAQLNTTLSSARSTLDEGYPPEPEVPILTRAIRGAISGTYERYLNAPSPIPLTAVRMAEGLEGYPGVLEEDIKITSEPATRIMTEYQHGASMIIDAHFESALEHEAFLAFTAAWADRPAARSVGMLARAYPKRFIASLGAMYARTVPNAYNTTL